MTEKELLDLCAGLVERAKAAGATEAEAMASWERSVESSLENNDLHAVETSEETTFGLRVLVGRSLGFITANSVDPSVLDRLTKEAVAQARATPEDPFNGLPAPQAVNTVEGLFDARVAEAGVAETTRLAGAMLERVRVTDGRIRVDSGAVSASTISTGLVSTAGVALFQRETMVSGYLFGMAVDGDDVASFDHDGDAARALGGLEDALLNAADRFAEKCLSGLGAGRGRSYKGAIVLSPEAVGEFLLPNLIGSISADAVRKGRSKLAGKVGARIASESFTLVDDGTVPGGVASSAFDRDGMPVGRWTLVDAGVLTTYLFNHYEARAAGGGARSTGHASGSASSLPGIGPNRLEVAPGQAALADLTAGKEPVVWVGRFSGSSNVVTGEFSGVVKNGFLVENGERRPIKETMIAGNLFDVLERVEAVSRERVLLEGTRLLPAVRIGGVSVTAG